MTGGVADVPEMQAGRGPSEQRPGLLIGVLTAIYCCAMVDRFLLALIVDPVKADLGLTDVQVSLVVGVAFSLFYGLWSIPAGFLADRVGRRGLVGGAAAMWCAMTAFCGFATAFPHLFIGRAGVGTAEAFITPTSLSLIRDRVPARMRGLAFSCFAMGPNVGGSVALFGGGALLAAAGHGAFAGVPVLGALHPWQVTLVLVGAAGLLFLLPLFALRRDDPAARPHLVDQVSWNAGELWTHLRARWLTYALLVAYVTFSAMLAFGINGWMPATMSRTFGIPIPRVGVISGPITLVAAVTGLVTCGIAIDRITARGGDILYFGMFAAIMAVAAGTAMPLVKSVTLAWLLYGATVFFMGSFYSVGISILARITPSALMGKVTAIYLVFQSSLGGALAPTTVALLARHFAGPAAIGRGLSLHCLILGLLGFAMAVLLSRRLRGPARGHFL